MPQRHSSRTLPAIEHPHLWSPASPYLYRVRTEVHDGNQVVDAVENPLGFRWFGIDAQKGFVLNGQPLRLFGTNRHQDYAGLGNALSDDLQRRDIRLIKETGFNFLRLAHYPQAPSVLDEADSRGVVVWEEIPVVNRIAVDRSNAQQGTDAAKFSANCERMLVEMIRQHYNHPAVFFWGTMNEVMLQKPRPLPEHYYETLLELERRLVERAHREDPSRKTAIALSRDELDDDHGVGDVPDVLGMNLYFGWYYGVFSDLGDFLDRMQRQRPSRPLVVSEYGAGSDDRVHSMHAEAFDFSSEYAQEYHRASFPQLESRPFLIATAVWNQFDFGSASRQDTRYGINTKGLFSYDRTAKDVARYYAAALRREPVVAIAREWHERTGSAKKDRQPLWVYTNQPAVELFVNGVSAGSKVPQNRTAQWNAELVPGDNRIVARAGTVEDAVTIHYDDRSRAAIIAVNAGSNASYTDRSDVTWEADRPYAPGSWGYARRRVEADASSNLRYGRRSALPGLARKNGGYRFDVPDGTYELTLRLCETSAGAKPGDRIFSIFANGQEIVHESRSRGGVRRLHRRLANVFRRRGRRPRDLDRAQADRR